MPRNPKPVKPRVRDAKDYERVLRRTYLAPMFRRLAERMATATGATQAFHAMNGFVMAMKALPKSGVPVAEIQKALDRMEGYHRKRIIQTFKAALKVDIRPFLTHPEIAAFMSRKISENVDLIKTIAPRLHESLKARLHKELAEAPFDQQRLTKLMRSEYKSSGYNLRRIVRDQNSKTIAGLTESRQGQLGIAQYQWLTSADERVRPTHVANSGLIFDWANPPADTGHPGNDVQCFPGSVRILPVGLKATVAYRYVGQVVQIDLAEGVDITVTPNHPILTKSGWKGAGTINESDELFVHRGARALAVRALDPNISYGYPSAQNLHSLAGGVRNLGRSSGRCIDLHGHVSRGDEEVEVVNIESVLRDDLETSALQALAYLSLERPDLISIARCLSPLGGSELGFSTATGVSRLGIGSSSQSAFFSGRKFGHADKISLGASSGWQSQLGEAQVYSRSWDAKILRYFQNRISELIAGIDIWMQPLALFGVGGVEGLVFDPEVALATTDEVDGTVQVTSNGRIRPALFNAFSDNWKKRLAPFAPVRVENVRFVHFDGPVYSVETESGLVSANGIITHNCRCVPAPILSQSTRNRLTGAGAHSIIGIGS